MWHLTKRLNKAVLELYFGWVKEVSSSLLTRRVTHLKRGTPQTPLFFHMMAPSMIKALFCLRFSSHLPRQCFSVGNANLTTRASSKPTPCPQASISHSKSGQRKTNQGDGGTGGAEEGKKEEKEGEIREKKKREVVRKEGRSAERSRS